MEPRTETSSGEEEIDVVRPHEVVGHRYDRLVQGLLAVVVGRVQGDGTAQLRDPDLFLDVLAQAGVEDLALTGLESVDQRRDGTGTIGDREVDQLLVNEVTVRQLVHVLVQVRAGLAG